MTVREYIGARYVPVFMGDWDNTVTYEPLSIVQYQGNSYTSRQYVPTGIEITNTDYWALTGNYNAQIEAYRQEVQAYDDRITTNTNNITALNEALPIADFDDENTVSDKFASIEGDLDTIESNSWVTTDRIANNAVTVDKIADEAVTKAKLSEALQIDIDKIENFNPIGDGYLVCIGDSIGQGWSPDGSSTPWPVHLGKYLGYDSSRVLNDSAGGATWAANDGNTFKDHLTSAANTLTQDQRNETTLIVIAGGVNDGIRNYSSSSIATAVNQAIIYAHTQFPNAKIAIFGPLMGNAGFCLKIRRVIEGINNGCMSYMGDALLIWTSESWQWLYDAPLFASAATSYVASDRLHALANGQKAIAHNMASMLNGGNTTPHIIPQIGVEGANGTAQPGLVWVREGMFVNWELHGNFASSVTTGNNFLKFKNNDERYAPYEGVYFVCWTSHDQCDAVNYAPSSHTFKSQYTVGAMYGSGTYTIENDIWS